MNDNQKYQKNSLKYFNTILNKFYKKKESIINNILTINNFINFYISKKDSFINYINYLHEHYNYYHPEQYNFELSINTQELSMVDTSLYFGHEEMKKLNNQINKINNKIKKLEKSLRIKRIITIQNLFRKKIHYQRNINAIKIQTFFRGSKLRKLFLKKIGKQYFANKIANVIIKNLINRTMNIIKKKQNDKCKIDNILIEKKIKVTKKNTIEILSSKKTTTEKKYVDIKDKLIVIPNKKKKKIKKKNTKKKKKKNKPKIDDDDYYFLKKEIEKNKNKCANIIIGFFRTVKVKNLKKKIKNKYANVIIRFFKTIKQKLKDINKKKINKITVEDVKKSLSILNKIKEKSIILKEKLNNIQSLFNFLIKDKFFKKNYLEDLKCSLKSIYKFYQKFMNMNDEKNIELENLKLLNRITRVKNFFENYKERSLFFHYKMNLCINVRKYLKFVIEDNDIKENIILDGFLIVDDICKNPFNNKDIQYYNTFAEKITKSLVLDYSIENKTKSLYKIIIISFIFEYLTLISDININFNCYNINNYKFREYNENSKKVYAEFIKCSYDKYKKFLSDISDENFLSKFRSKNQSYCEFKINSP